MSKVLTGSHEFPETREQPKGTGRIRDRLHASVEVLSEKSTAAFLEFEVNNTITIQ